MRSNNVCVARSEAFIHQAMINCLFCGATARKLAQSDERGSV
jgi:hypothetical protein